MKLVTVKWDTTPADAALITAIARRAIALMKNHTRKKPTLLDMEMDITAAHLNGCPLDLQKFLGFPDFDFMHDYLGIRENIDRRSGRLLNCFLPRSAQHGKGVSDE